ncbi:formylglycine-generating enzyme family protein [Wenzhouxiangella sp. XN79A]|uniref:formylglycine-generating enzyme family protein n=1 Tax=Wenzhouxiangella sp. XN79A TaxID=2724193 RepID=UPI00144ABB9D|nr:formylglycine-generating enzyme family protein [Wenzhouxiangella sp. XN79A]NKI34195.1 formylglycine-generating enzyme family protein [Wenzhouxiangella sp. XN79A]
MKRWIALMGLVVLFAMHGSAWSQEEQDDAQAGTAAAEPATEDEERRVRRLGDVIGEGTQEWSMDIPAIETPAVPVEEQPQVSLPDPEQDAQLQNLLTRRAFVPDDPDIAAELQALLDDVEEQAGTALAAGNLALAGRLANVLAELDADRAIIGRVAAARERADSLARLLAQADTALQDGNLIEPEDGAAWTLYGRALAIESDNAAALAGQDAVRSALLDAAEQRIADNDFERADELLAAAAERDADADRIDALENDLTAARADQMRALAAEIRASIDEEAYEQAEQQINQLVALGAPADDVESLRTLLDDAIRYGGFEPGQVFQDGLGDGDGFGPVMVVVPSGSFIMGSPEDEDNRVGNEGPQFRVRFENGFAMAQTEVTVGQFARFIEETGYVTDAERARSSRVYRSGSGRVDEQRGVTWRMDYLGEDAEENLPVVHVSWNDANAYALWLARRTGRPYRLPSEAEFEYALRAGSQTPYWWGEGSPDEPVENVTGDGDQFTDSRSWTVAFDRYNDGFWGPAPVGSLQTNPFGLYDMGGNVMEWLEDCWHDSYVRAPDDGSAWVNPGCERRMLRGASWSSTPSMSRSAFRLSSRNDSTDARVGFRVARDL